MDTLAAGSNDMEITAGAIEGSGGEGTELPAAGDASQPSAELEHSRKISEARDEYSNASLEVLRIENEIGSLKRELKDAKETADALGLRLQMLLDGEDDDSDTPASESGEAAAASPEEAPSDWRAVPLETVIGKIKGLGKKKLDAILCITPTLGAFEDLRKECGEYGGLFGKMPEGVGKGMCSKLEDAVIEWLAEHWKTAGDSPPEDTPIDHNSPGEIVGNINLEAMAANVAPEAVADQAEPNDPEQAAEEPAEESPDEPAEPVTVNPAAVDFDSTTPQAPERDSAELLAELESRRDEVIEKYPLPWIDSAPFTNIYEEGREDFIAGKLFHECPWQPGLQQDSWILGFQFESDRAVPSVTDQNEDEAGSRKEDFADLI